MTLSNDFILFTKLAAGLVLDYIRWTQLVPMIIGWAFALIMVIAMTLITFQGEIDNLIVWAEDYVEQYLGPAPSPAETTDAGTIEFSGDDIIPWILKLWGILALLGWILGIIRSKIFGPKPAKKLWKKIRFASLAAILFAAVVLLLILLLGGSTGANTFEIILPIILMPALLIIVSTWGLTVSHVIDLLHDAIDKIGSDENPEELIKTTI